MNSYYQAYRNKITNKLWGVVHLSTSKIKKGIVLLSYMTEPFTLLPNEKLSTLHSNYWECQAIATIFLEHGYDVDVISWNNKTFIPKKKYAFCIDIHSNLERLTPYLPKECKKILHIVSSYWKFQNTAEQQRLDQLKMRRGIILLPQRTVTPSESISIADYVEGFGNETSYSTYAFAHKKIHPIPISSVCTYDFNRDKNWNAVRKNYLWIGGGGAVLKGLDLILEAFSSLPDYSLFVCGPVEAEKDFTKFYHRELFEMKNIHYVGRINVESKEFIKILDTCVGTIHASGSEGGGGSAIQVMQAGLIPIATRESTVPVGDFGLQLEEASVDSIKQAVIKLSNASEKELELRSQKTWNYTRTHHTRSAFYKEYTRFVEDILHI